MSFEGILKSDIKKEDLNKEGYRHSSKERVHMSKSMMDMYSNARYLKTGEFFAIHYKDETVTRYIAATDLTYDFIISIFDVNTRNLLVYRIFRFSKLVEKDIAKIADSLKKNGANLEARIIGMQNNEDFSYVLTDIADFLISRGIKLLEVDLFGDSIRHIAIDAKFGMSYNVLMEDRLYRPGELINSMTLENFEATLKQESQFQKK